MANPTGFETPAGLSKHTWVDRPDTKFDTDGLFKTKLVGDLSNPKIVALRAKIDAAAQAAFDEELKDLTPGQRKKWQVYLPYTLEEDEEGNETGRIVFEFKRNAKVTIRKTGEVKELSVAVYDSAGNAVKPAPAIYGGSTIKVMGSFRPIKISATQKAGVRMDFFAVKVLKMSQGAGGNPFSNDEEIEDGWTSNATENSTSAGSEPADIGGDY